MQYEVNTPEEYLNALDDDWRKNKLESIREMILNSPGIDEGIKYKMLSYSLGDNHIFSLNAQKGYVSLYVGDISKVEGADELLEGLNYGKGCIRIKKSNDLNRIPLNEFISKVISTWQKGGKTDC